MNPYMLSALFAIPPRMDVLVDILQIKFIIFAFVGSWLSIVTVFSIKMFTRDKIKLIDAVYKVN